MTTRPSTAYDRLRAQLTAEPATWLVTGAAGFIGSNLVETLLKLNQRVVGLDNFATGYQRNLDEVRASVTDAQWENFHFINGDIRVIADCKRALTFVYPERLKPSKASSAEPLSAVTPATVPVQYVLHQAALGSVPRSLADPILTNSTNVTGFLNVLVAARDAGIRGFVYAASSSTYGDHPALPKVEHIIGRPLSPYAVTKYVNELYAEVFSRCFDFPSIGLRYFNVFGKRQDPEGAYAAVIPKWTLALLRREQVYINGDGKTSRDFCYVENAVQANLLAATTAIAPTRNEVYNVAAGGKTDLNTLFSTLKRILIERGHPNSVEPVYRAFREGDVRHSQADISKASHLLGYAPQFDIFSGLEEAMPWYIDFFGKKSKRAKTLD